MTKTISKKNSASLWLFQVKTLRQNYDKDYFKEKNLRQNYDEDYFR